MIYITGSSNNPPQFFFTHPHTLVITKQTQRKLSYWISTIAKMLIAENTSAFLFHLNECQNVLIGSKLTHNKKL